MTELIERREDIKRHPMHIEGFDEQLEGGIPVGHVCLMAGKAGTMKSSVSFNAIYHEVKAGRNALYLSLEQSSTSLLNHMIGMGFDLSAINVIILSDVSKLDKCVEAVRSNKGSLVMSDVGAIRKQLGDLKSMGPEADWLNAIKNIVKKLAADKACDLFVLDSMSALYALSKLKNPRSELFYVFEFLRDIGITSYLISEIIGEQYGEFGVEDYLSDGIISFAMVRDGRKVRREIAVIKMRATDTNNDVFILDYKNKVFRALTKLPY
ncbi:MAG: ATPase domain-containing protein [Candidatus Woesearchaeota archaeon]